MMVLEDNGYIQELIEKRVAEFPDSVALGWKKRKLTYNELNVRANQLAHYLRKRGVGPEVVVGVCMTHSFELIVGILGVLKAGGAYLPLDPSYPSDRKAYILKDSNTHLILTNESTARLFQKDIYQVLSLDQQWSEISEFTKENPQKNNSPDNLAYIIYTSGSTGKPKGVMVTHSNLSQFVRISSSVLDISQDDKYLQSASITYALSVRQMMTPLCAGSVLVLAEQKEAGDPLALFELIKQQGVTLMDMVPSFFRTCIRRLSVLSDIERRILLDNRLRRIVTVGEPLHWDIPRDWMDKFGQSSKIVNIFGQTETTGLVAAYPILDLLSHVKGAVPIGKSIQDTHLYILDSDLQPVMDGETGELCVSNSCVARGYLNQPALTSEKFIPNPFEDGYSERLYRTGDMARIGKDGNIQFLGRSDTQVKIRGQRLELTEVEAILLQHSNVHECVVIAQGELPDEKHLVAYIVPSSDQSLSSRDLRDFLKSQLPDYMVPLVFLFLDKLPTTPNGKIDRLSLPDPRDMPRSIGQKYRVAPQNPVEQKLSAIWQDLLNIESVGIHDDFFDLGGHSFLAVQLFSHIERDLGVRLPLTTLFHASTIAQISVLIQESGKNKPDWSPLVPVRTTGDKPPFFGVHGREGGVLFWRDIFEHLPVDQPFYALQAQGIDGLLPALTSIEEMASLYIDEIRKVQPTGPYYLGGYSMGGVIAFEMGQQLIQKGECVKSLVMFDTLNPKQKIFQDTDGHTLSRNKRRQDARLQVVRLKLLGYFRRLIKINNLKRLIAFLFEDIRNRVSRRYVFILVGIMRKFQKRLPDRLLRSYLNITHSQAVYKYNPKMYTGKVTLFRASQTASAKLEDAVLSWRNLTNGNTDTYYFEATHNITSKEFAEEIARQLTECLSKAFLD